MPAGGPARGRAVVWTEVPQIGRLRGQGLLAWRDVRRAATATASSDSDGERRRRAATASGEQRRRAVTATAMARARLSPPALTWSWDGLDRAQPRHLRRQQVVSVAVQRGRERGPRSVMVQPGDSTATSGTLDRGWGWGPVRRGFGGEAPNVTGCSHALPGCDDQQPLHCQPTMTSSPHASRLRLPAALTLPACEDQQPKPRADCPSAAPPRSAAALSFGPRAHSKSAMSSTAARNQSEKEAKR